jgi:hypothetical protein
VDDEFARAPADLVRRMRRWSVATWTIAVGRGRARSRADAVHAGVQRLADLAASAEGRPSRPVPRLDDRVLPDQLAVTAHDVRETGDAAAERVALTELTALRRLLGYR